MDLEISNVVSISVSAAPMGLGSYNTSNIALFTKEVPGSSFGADPFKIYKSASEVTKDFGSGSATSMMAQVVFGQKPNILAGNGYLVVIPMLPAAGEAPAETIAAAITRTSGMVQYFGILVSEITSSVDMAAAALVVESMSKIAFWPSKTAADVEVGGMLDSLRSASQHQNRGLLYIGTGLSSDALKLAAAYASRALSTDFSGSNTTLTVHLKDFVGVTSDAGMTETLLMKCQAAGVDCYPSLQGVAKVFTSPANKFFDDVYNQLWFAGAIKIAGFNALAQSSTKVPQTEAGVDVLKSAYRTVCEQAVSNRYAAPGTWNSPDTFGNLGDFMRNIEERGYYIYSAPISAQLQADRDARKAPLIQIAIKQAGAVHSSNVIIFVNA